MKKRGYAQVQELMSSARQMVAERKMQREIFKAE